MKLLKEFADDRRAHAYVEASGRDDLTVERQPGGSYAVMVVEPEPEPEPVEAPPERPPEPVASHMIAS